MELSITEYKGFVIKKLMTRIATYHDVYKDGQRLMGGFDSVEQAIRCIQRDYFIKSE